MPKVYLLHSRNTVKVFQSARRVCEHVAGRVKTKPFRIMMTDGTAIEPDPVAAARLLRKGHSLRRGQSVIEQVEVN